MFMMPHVNPRPARRGFTMLEIIVTVIVFGVVLSLVTTLTRRAIDQRRLLDTRRAALLEVSNALEVLEADPAARPQPGRQRQLELPEALANKLDEPTLIARATSLAGPPARLRLDVELTWMTGQNRPAAPITLSTVVFPMPRSEEESGAGEMERQGG